MKAIEIRVNKIRFATEEPEKTRYARALQHGKFGSKKFIEFLSGNGCPKMLGKQFAHGCADVSCGECWEQTPYEYINTRPHLYDKK